MNKRTIATLMSLLVLPLTVLGMDLDKKVEFNIGAQDLASALIEFSKQARVQVIVSDDLTGHTTQGVSGEKAIKQALSQLLQPAGLGYQVAGETSITIGKTSALKTHTTRAAHESPPTRVAQAGSPGDASTGNDQGSENSDDLARTLPDNGGSIQEVVVTAQRRTERLIDVPLSLSVLGIEEIERRGLVSREDYLRSVPAVSVRDDGVGLAEIVIRGAYGDSFRTGPTVGLYFGDVPLSGYAIGGSADVKLIDMQRVEVLRGPQGTLYGSNALSGAVRYVPEEPDLQQFSGSVRAGYSSTARYGGANNSIDGVLNVPIVADKFALRAVAFRHFFAGYVRNVAGGDASLQAAAAARGASSLAVNKDHVGDTEYTGGRVSALWQPTESLSINLTYLMQRDAQDDRLFELRQAGPYRRSDYQLGDIIGGSEDAQRIDLDIVNLTASYELGLGTLYSSTAWMEQKFIRKWDIGSLTSLFPLPLQAIDQASTTNADVFAQELRYTSEFDGPFQVVAGLYYEDSGQPTQQPTYFAGDPARNPYAAVKLWQIDLERDVEQKAAYGQLSYAFTPALKLTLGGRHFDYESRFSTRTFDTVVLAPSSSDGEAQESGATYKAGVEYNPGDSSTVYASWSQGFRLGRPLATELIRAICDPDGDGFINNTNISSTLNRVDSDRLDSYEVGAKFGFMGGRSVVSAAIYQNDWTDIPVVFQPPGCSTTLTINGGSAQARGFEGEASFRFFDSVKLNLGVGYVDSELTKTTTLGRDGDELNFTPEWNGNLGLEYAFTVAGRDSYVRGDYTYFGAYYTQTGHRGIRADAYGLVNLRGGVAVTERADILVHVDNALNADDYTTVLGPSGFPPGYSVRLRPRTIGIGLTYRY